MISPSFQTVAVCKPGCRCRPTWAAPCNPAKVRKRSSSPGNSGQSAVVRPDCVLSKLGVTRVTWLVSREESGVQVSF